MNRKTLGLLSWSKWSLLVTLSFSSLPTVYGQAYQHAPAKSMTHDKRSSEANGQTSARASYLSVDQEMRIRIGWYSSPSTFPLHLEIKNTPQGVKVVGVVPNASVRKQALAIARTHAGFELIDGLRVVSGVAGRFNSGTNPAQLEQKAREIIAAAAPDCAGGVKVSANEYGKISLSGNTNTLKQHLDICKALRRLPECTGLNNRIFVGHSNRPPGMAKGEPTTQEPKMAGNAMPSSTDVQAVRSTWKPASPSKLPPVAAPFPTPIKKKQTPPITTTSKTPAKQPKAPKKLNIGDTRSIKDLGEPYQAVALVSWVSSSSEEIQPVDYRPETVPPPVPPTQSAEDNQPIETQAVPSTVPAETSPVAPSPVQQTSKVIPTQQPRIAISRAEDIIRQVCGREATQVSAHFLPDGKLEAQVLIVDIDRAPELFDQIASIPDLGPYRLKVKFDVANP